MAVRASLRAVTGRMERERAASEAERAASEGVEDVRDITCGLRLESMVLEVKAFEDVGIANLLYPAKP